MNLGNPHQKPTQLEQHEIAYTKGCITLNDNINISLPIETWNKEYREN